MDSTKKRERKVLTIQFCSEDLGVSYTQIVTIMECFPELVVNMGKRRGISRKAWEEWKANNNID